MSDSTVILNSNELGDLVRRLSIVFDIVRLTDPVTLRSYSVDKDGRVSWAEGRCFELFGRKERCENCTGLASCRERQRLAKFIPMDDARPLVFSTPISFRRDNGETVDRVLEAVVMNSSGLFTTDPDGRPGDVMARENPKLYTDLLTGAWNRLYFEERIFSDEAGCETSFIMTDIRDFKSINDTYGHPVGDTALRMTVEVMKRHVRATDAVVRMGGDEFLIILFHCSEEDAHMVEQKIRDSLRTGAVYDKKSGGYVRINMGIDFRQSFDGTRETVQAMYQEADRRMYIDKGHVQREGI